jgi:glutathione S-transferase
MGNCTNANTVVQPTEQTAPEKAAPAPTQPASSLARLFKDGKPQISKPVFFDMVHSNNAARVRLWIRLKGMSDIIDDIMITYADLQSEEYKIVNPLKKVPSFITDKGNLIFESQVIMTYLEDRYGDQGPSMVMDEPEDKAFVNLLVRMHDLYIASPNCTQPNFSHSQGSMYLPPYETPTYAAARTMDHKTRAAKLAEIWKQLSWLETQIKSPYMAGDRITHADMTWFPTTIFMEFLLPRNFSWPEVFHESEHFPRLTAWWSKCMESDIFQAVRKDIFDFWEKKEKDGEFEAIRGVVKEVTELKWTYP